MGGRIKPVEERSYESNRKKMFLFRIVECKSNVTLTSGERKTIAFIDTHKKQ